MQAPKYFNVFFTIKIIKRFFNVSMMWGSFIFSRRVMSCVAPGLTRSNRSQKVGHVSGQELDIPV